MGILVTRTSIVAGGGGGDSFAIRDPNGSDKYVDASAADDLGSGSSASPWKTVTAARYQSIAAGQQIVLRQGTYNWPDVTGATNGTSTDRVILRSYPSELGTLVFTDSLQRVGNAEYHAWHGVDIQCDNHGIMLGNGFVLTGDEVSKYFRLVDCTGTRNSITETDNSGIVEAYGNTSLDCATVSAPIQIIRCQFFGPAGATGNQSLIFLDYVEGVEIIGCLLDRTANPIYFKHTNFNSADRQYGLVKNCIIRRAGRGFQAAMNYVQYLNNAIDACPLGMDESGGGIAGGNNCTLTHNTFLDSGIGMSITDSGTHKHLSNVLLDNALLGTSRFEDNPFNVNSGEDQLNTSDYTACEGAATNHYYRNSTQRTLAQHQAAFAGQETNGVAGTITLVGGTTPGNTAANWAMASGVGVGAASDATDCGVDASKLLTIN